MTWHGFYRDPTTHYRLVVPLVRRRLAEAGLPVVPLFVDEWNIAATPPYPEGDLNGGPVGAAFVAASLIAMGEAGLDGQTFQMVVDPGGEGYSGGTFTPSGVPRPNFETFRLFSRLAGTRCSATSGHDHVRVAAFDDGKTLRVLVSSSCRASSCSCGGGSSRSSSNAVPSRPRSRRSARLA